MAFARRFTFDPGLEVISEIEGIVIIDREPPASITGVGSGTVCIVGEFEDGDFGVPTEVASASDLLATFGGFGFSYDGVTANNPCARSRKADAALNPEFWNGNGFVALANKKFARLIVTRVDTTVGAVEFTRHPSLTGGGGASYNLEPAQTVVLDLGAGNVTATFTAQEARLDSAAGVYPTLFVGGEQMVISVDQGTTQPVGPVTVTFLASDQTQAQVVARINAAMGYTCASILGGGVTRLSGRVRGTSGNVKVVSISAAAVVAIGYLAGASAAGTGNVGNIDAVTFLEVKVVVEAAIAGTLVEQDLNGNLRFTSTATSRIRYAPASTADALGFVENQQNTQPDGIAIMRSVAGVYPTVFVGGEQIQLQVDGGAPVLVTFTVLDQTEAQVCARINTALGYTGATTPAATFIEIAGRVNGGSVTVLSASAPAVLVTLGLALETITAVANVDGTLPAGTRVRNGAALEWVTAKSIEVTAGNAGPYSVRVRPGLDDGTLAGTAPLTATVLPEPVQLASFTVTNPLALTAALTEAAIDAAYSDALDTTKNAASVASQTNLIVCARQSNVVRNAVRSNADSASAEVRGRMGAIRPPLNTKRSVAKSGSMQPGVGAYRDQRVIYAYPGVATFLPQIARRGVSGGAGFTVDGIIDVGFDVFVVSVCSQLPPEENPAQQTDFLLGVLSLEKGNADVQTLTMADYIAFKAAGIAAPRIDNGTPIIQSGVTSVDPSITPNLKNINRRRMADFIEDSLALRLQAFNKRLATRARRGEIVGEIDGFLNSLLSPNSPSSQRIDGYSIDAKSGNTPLTLAAGIFRIKIKVRTLSSLDDIVLEVTAGESVDVSELPAAA